MHGTARKTRRHEPLLMGQGLIAIWSSSAPESLIGNRQSYYVGSRGVRSRAQWAIVTKLCAGQSFNPRADLPMSTSSLHRRVSTWRELRSGSAWGRRPGLNKRPIIHPKPNNRHSPSIVSFPRKNPRAIWG